MSVRLTDDTSVALYDSVTGLPLPIEVFDSEESALAFLAFAAERDIDLRRATPTTLDRLSGEFSEQRV